jgi:hypothetical protein
MRNVSLEERIVSTFEIGTGRARIRLTWQRWGSDLHVQIAGGDQHIGAVALVGQQPGGEKSEGVLRVPPHKEDQLALGAARKLHAALGVNVCVSAGIHLDAITSDEIAATLRSVDEGVERLVERLKRI